MSRSALLAASALVATLAVARPAASQEAPARLEGIEKQIQSLQAELRRMKAEMADRHAEYKAAQAQAARNQVQTDRAAITGSLNIPPGYALVPAGPGSEPGTVVLAKTDTGRKLKQGQFQVGGVTVTLGGFIDVSGIFRSRNEVADEASNWNGIPLRNSQLYHEPEFRGSARASRITVLAEGSPDDQTLLGAYLETDFQAGPPTANSAGSSSYSPRLRQAYATYDQKDWGFEFLGGQTWSLLTMYKSGVTPRSENIPILIDQQYLPGFTYARIPQVRFVKTFDKTFTLAASLESPQTTFYTGPNGLAPSTLGTVNVSNPGTGYFASTVNYSDDIAPDAVVKGTADLGPAHLEAYGVGTVIHDRVSELGSGVSNTTFGGGGGAAALIHVIPKMLDVQVSGLVGKGIGRYGAGGLPDAVVGSDGSPNPLPEFQALAGIIGHPVPTVDVYGYLGTEQISRKYFSADVKGKEVGYGYGSPLYSNATCDIELGASSGCVGNTSGLVAGTVGGWWRFLKGSYGTMQTGVQYSYTHRSVFQGAGTTETPKTDENVVMLSFRYYPFQ
jgi:hypothetical protein